jgi:phage/plasmid-like protein (TIGR03299 family)
MPADIEIIEGQASFASLREPGWHQLGTVFTKPATVGEIMRMANLDGWNVRTIEIEAPDFNMNDAQYFFVVRDNPVLDQVDVLSISGKRYTPFQNEAMFNIGNDLVTGGVGRWETAGSLKGGRVVFASISIDREVVLDPSGANDVIKNYLMLAASHDGTLAVTAANTPVRVVCSNTLNWALSGAKQTFSFRHTQTAGAKAAYVTKAIANAHGYIDRFEGVARQLINAKLTEKQWNDVLLAAYPKPEEKEEGKANRAMTMWTKKFDNLNSLRTAETNSMWDGTAWGALQVLTEDLDWFRTGRGDNAAENLAAARSGFDPAVNATRNKFLSIVSEVAGV